MLSSFRIVWMNPHGCVYPLVIIRDSNRFMTRVKVVAYAYDSTYARSGCPLDYLFSVPVEVRPLKMCMSIDQS